jgi:hypothetical protein
MKGVHNRRPPWRFSGFGNLRFYYQALGKLPRLLAELQIIKNPSVS